MSVPDRKAMVKLTGKVVSVRRQCEFLGLARSSVYREKSGPAADDLALMQRIDGLHLELPFYGSTHHFISSVRTLPAPPSSDPR